MQVPVQALPSHAAMQYKAAAPCLASRPPDHDARKGNCNRRKRTNTVDHSTPLPRQQIIVQIEQECHHAHAGCYRVPQVAASPWIEPPVPKLIAALQADIYHLIGISRSAHLYHSITGIQTLRGVRELLPRQSWQ